MNGPLPTTPDEYKVTRELLRDKAKSSSIVLHSLPRMDELPTDVDSTRHARYWTEAFNGVVMRMVKEYGGKAAELLGRAEKLRDRLPIFAKKRRR